MKMLKIVIAALLLLGLVALAGIGRPESAGGASEETRNGITVTGVGQVDAVPDQAQLSVGVTTKGSSAREAMTANAAQMERVIDALKGAGVAARDIRTQDVSVGQGYDEKGADGYSASNTVTVTVRRVDRVGAVLEAASRAGANQVYGPSMTRENSKTLEHRALELAVKNARERAETLAKAADVSLGSVTAITESPAQDGVIYAERAALAKDTPIEKGTQEISASVTVTFAIE